MFDKEHLIEDNLFLDFLTEEEEEEEETVLPYNVKQDTRQQHSVSKLAVDCNTAQHPSK